VTGARTSDDTVATWSRPGGPWPPVQRRERDRRYRPRDLLTLVLDDNIEGIAYACSMPARGARRVYFRMNRFAQMITTTGVRGRVAIANLCLSQTIIDEAVRCRAALVLCEFYWEFVEQDLTSWHDRRRGFAAIDEIGSIKGRTGRMLELVDLAATEYLFSVFRSGPDRLCVDLGDTFAQVFGQQQEKLLTELCAISPVQNEEPKSRWAYLDAWSRKPR
jgi:hypothetical protein